MEEKRDIVNIEMVTVVLDDGSELVAHTRYLHPSSNI